MSKKMAVSIFSTAQNLALMISNEVDFISGVPDQAQSLLNEISLMTSALQDASERRRTRNEVKEWLNQVRDAVMEAEDVIDFFIVERQRHINVLTKYICYPNLLWNLHKLGKKFEISNKKIEHLSVRRSTLGLATSEAGQSSVGMVTNEQGLPFRRGDRVEEFWVIGFEKEENEIVKKLVTPIEPPRPCPTVVSIVGMGGSGKTTLARKVYKRNDVREHFQSRAWVSVSQQYNIRDLLLVIIEQIKPLTPEEKKELDVESLIHRLSSNLKETTYLIAFDDLWRAEDWNILKQALPVQGEDYQSRVLVTTRNETVARYADPITDPFHQRLLNEDESWKLFITKVMTSKTASCPEDLEDLGWKIVYKCHGLPLAIVVLGGLLSIKPKTRIAWSKVLDSIDWELNQNGWSCKQVLALSYTDLPDHLKPCFLYVGLLPEDYEIDRFKLIWLWVAEGFIRQRQRLTMEDVAEDYLEELIQRSMIQATVRSYDGRVIRCRIHDLIRDLAISEAKHERFLEIVGSDDLVSPNKSRRLSIIESAEGIYGSPTNALNQHTTPNHLHSLLCFSELSRYRRITWMKPLYGGMKLLRILDLEDAGCIPSSSVKHIGKLILLKYLSLDVDELTELPSSIGDLQNLQTLFLRYTCLRLAPMMMMKLQQLRNLVFSYIYHDPVFQSFDCPLDHMTNLQTLALNEGKWIEGSLDKLTNLRALSIRSIGSLSPYKEALLNAIPKLKHLRALRLGGNSTAFGTDKEALVLPVSFLDHLELYHMTLEGTIVIRDFPPNLTTLIFSLRIEQGMDELMATLKKLPKLRCLILEMRYLGSKIIFSAGGFSQLEEVVLINADDLEEFLVEEGALPNFRVLRIASRSLKRLPVGLKRVITLQELTLSCISEELEYRVQKDIGEDWEIIKHISSIDTKSEWKLRNSPHVFRHWC